MKEHEHPYWGTPKKAHEHGYSEAIESDPSEQPEEIWNKKKYSSHPNYKHFSKGYKEGRKEQKEDPEG